MGNRAIRRVVARTARWLRHRLDRIHGPYIIFDVGSSDGRQFLSRCREDSNTIVYAFEPEPGSFSRVLQNTAGLPNFHAFQLAVSDVEGDRVLNVASVIGNHSLHEFVEHADEIWRKPYAEHLPWVPGFASEGHIRVKATRLDSFIKAMDIPYVSYLHIDAQGEDLNVLRSLGDKMPIVRAGVIEVCLKPLYRNHFTRAEATAFLEANGFRITETQLEHFGLVENVYFRRAAPAG